MKLVGRIEFTPEDCSLFEDAGVFISGLSGYDIQEVENLYERLKARLEELRPKGEAGSRPVGEQSKEFRDAYEAVNLAGSALSTLAGFYGLYPDS